MAPIVDASKGALRSSRGRLNGRAEGEGEWYGEKEGENVRESLRRGWRVSTWSGLPELRH